MTQHTHAVKPSTCSDRDCDRAAVTQGMCHRHYKRTRPRTPDKPRIVQCVVCRVELTRSPTSANRRTFGHTCSQRCTTVLLKGETCDLPVDHWARMWGASSPVYISNCAQCQRLFTSSRSTRRYCTQACAHPSIPAVLLGRACGDCGKAFTTYRADRLWCSSRCAGRVSKRTRRAHENQAIGTYTWMDITKLWALFDQACAYCRTPTPLDQIQAEHVIPISRRGVNNMTNLLPACRFCNGDKRDLSLTAWAESRVLRGLAPVTTTWDEGDPRYKHLVITSQRALSEVA